MNGMGFTYRAFVALSLLLPNAVYSQESEQESGQESGQESEQLGQFEQAEQSTAIVEVLVTGEQPGPGLWKISKGDHVMWVLGTYGPLPKKMIWKSRDVEAVIAQSQMYLDDGVVKSDIGFFKQLTLLPSLIGFRDNPNDEKLKDIVPPELYERWSVLKQKYLASNKSVEKWRPIFASQELYREAIEKSGMERSRDLREDVRKFAKKAKVKIVNPTVKVSIDKPRNAIKEFKKSSLDDIDCFAKTIERLEVDLELMRTRANAWATGNVAELRKVTNLSQATACISAVMNAQVVQDRGLQDIPERITEAWLRAAEDSLAHNSSTFTVISIDEIYKPDGLVAKLRERGYQVDEPL
jgi:hypothetical protein